MIFDSNSDLDVVSNISIYGDLTNNTDSLKFLGQTVQFEGTGSSNINGTHTTTFNDLEIDKSSNAVLFDTAAFVSGFMSLTNGSLNLNKNILTITNQTPTAISRTNGYILSEDTLFDGILSWDIGTDVLEYEFPFGTSSGDYIPFLFQLNSGDAGTVSIATYGTGADNLPLPPTVSQLNYEGANNSASTVDRFYHIDLAGSTSPNADVTFNASASEVGTIGSLQAQRWGSGWDEPLPGQVAGATSVMVPGVTQFSPWAISGNSQPLPVDLIDFTATKVGNTVDLNWYTATEKNNDYFEVQKSSDGLEFKTIGKVEGANNSVQSLSYKFNDSFLLNGVSYYRLKQVDYNEGFSYSKIATVNNVNNDLGVVITPNPATNQFRLVFEEDYSTELSYELLDLSGSVVLSGNIETQNSNSSQSINVSTLSSGIYLLQLKSNSTIYTNRIVVE